MTKPTKLRHDLDSKDYTCRAVIETPKGSRSKFDYDPDSGLFLLAGLVPAGMSFPLSFGFIPSTRAEDGDPLDVRPVTLAALIGVWAALSKAEFK